MDTLTPRPDDPGSRAATHVARLEALCREHHRALVAFLQCRLQSASDAQEVAQEAYVRMLTLDRPEEIDDLRAYLFRSASNLAMDRLRSRTVHARAVDEAAVRDPLAAPAPERRAMALERLIGLRQALGELPPKTREAFMAHMIEGLDLGVVARAMKLSERMVRYHVTRALAHCRARVDQMEER